MAEFEVEIILGHMDDEHTGLRIVGEVRGFNVGTLDDDIADIETSFDTNSDIVVTLKGDIVTFFIGDSDRIRVRRRILFGEDEVVVSSEEGTHDEGVEIARMD